MPNHFNIDTNEIAKFSQLANDWWDLEGPCKPLHVINPIRLSFITQHAKIAGKKILDIGCGGGILAESMADLGAQVTGIDMSEAALTTARTHAAEKSLQLDYQLATAEEYAAQLPQQFDVVTCMELLEHVPAPIALIQACAKLVKPDGQLFFSTVNRTLKAYLFAILGAEYIAKMLPKGTHEYAKFIRPSELCAWLREADLEVQDIKGIEYQGLLNRARISENVAVNYIAQVRLAN